jgi:hypothetical protein
VLSAAKEKTPSLDLVRLILSLANQHQEVPDVLRRHLMDVIAQARQLAGDPSSVKGAVSPEAVALARQIRAQSNLAAVVNQITSFDSINSELASSVLHNLERRTAATY